MFATDHIDLADPGARDIIATHATGQDHDAVKYYATPRRQAQGLAARALLRAMLERYSDYPGHTWSITRDSRGKPSARRPDGGEPINISLSHSRGMAACALTDQGDIGIDVEYLKPMRPVIEIAAAAFGQRETQLVMAGGPTAFYRIWTLREALAKAFGAGFAMLTDQTDYFGDAPVAAVWQSSVASRRVLLRYQSIRHFYGMAVALIPRRGERAE